jgi:hypothetical protein
MLHRLMILLSLSLMGFHLEYQLLSATSSLSRFFCIVDFGPVHRTGFLRVVHLYGQGRNHRPIKCLCPDPDRKKICLPPTGKTQTKTFSREILRIDWSWFTRMAMGTRPRHLREHRP